MDYYSKYLKYKNKYLQLKTQHGGCLSSKLTLALSSAQINILLLGVKPDELIDENDRLRNLVTKLKELGFHVTPTNIRITLCDKFIDPLKVIPPITYETPDITYTFEIKGVKADFTKSAEEFLGPFGGETFDVIANDWSVIVFIHDSYDAIYSMRGPFTISPGTFNKRFTKELNKLQEKGTFNSNTDYEITYNSRQFTVSVPANYPFAPPTINGITYPSEKWKAAIILKNLLDTWDEWHLDLIVDDKRRDFFDILHDKLLKPNGVLLLQSVRTEDEVLGKKYDDISRGACPKTGDFHNVKIIINGEEKKIKLYGPLEELTVDCLKIQLGFSHERLYGLIYAGKRINDAKLRDLIKEGFRMLPIYVALSVKRPYIVEHLKHGATRYKEPFILYHRANEREPPVFYVWRKS